MHARCNIIMAKTYLYLIKRLKSYGCTNMRAATRLQLIYGF